MNLVQPLGVGHLEQDSPPWSERVNPVGKQGSGVVEILQQAQRNDAGKACPIKRQFPPITRQGPTGIGPPLR